MPAGSQNGYPTPGPQSPTGQKVMDQVYFCSDYEWETIRESGTFDFVVIGTGICGLAFVEKTLSNNPMARILMLERGEYFLPEHFQNLPSSFFQTKYSETFPWTLSSETANGKYLKFVHGMIPFFGGRSTLWSAWCPKPNKDEFYGWSEDVVNSANNYFNKAEKLLNVVQAGAGIDMDPLYDHLQDLLTKNIGDNLHKVGPLTRSTAAPLAVGVHRLKGISYKKFATPGPLLELRNKFGDAKDGKGAHLKIVCNCVVEEIYQQDNKATALKTSRGVVNLGDAKLILAMGTVPPATLIMNSFDCVPNVGKHFSAHLISAIVGRISLKDLADASIFNDMELAAVYVAGIDNDYGKQFHVQLSAFYNKKQDADNANFAYQYAPDVVATASAAQLDSSYGYVVFVLACLGEIGVENNKNAMKMNKSDDNQASNIFLNLTTDSLDEHLWDVMDESSFQLLENIISPTDESGKSKVEYWHGTSDEGKWSLNERPPTTQIRVPGTVHESSTLIIGDADTKDTSVGLDYRPHGVDNVYVTGGCLWPRSGSWNPTLTMVALAQHLADNLALPCDK